MKQIYRDNALKIEISDVKRTDYFKMLMKATFLVKVVN